MLDRLDVLTAGVTSIARLSVADPTFDETLAHQAIAGADVGGVAMLVAGPAGATAFTDGNALALDIAQYGPSLVAQRTKPIRRVESMDRDRRWPAFSPAASSSSVVSSLSVPVIAHGEAIGAVNWYSHTGSASSTDDEVAERRCRPDPAREILVRGSDRDLRDITEKIVNRYWTDDVASNSQPRGAP